MPRSVLFRHPALWKSLLRGAAAVLIIAAVVVPIVCFAWTALAVFATIVVGLNLGLWAGRDSGLASLAGGLLIPSIGLVIVIYSDVQTFGPAAEPITLNEISRHSRAASFRFADARVATEFAGAVAGSTMALGSWRAAPIVTLDWTPDDPVQAWAVANVSGYGPRDFRTPRNWQHSYRAAVRYVVTDFSPAQRAVARSIERFRLKPARHAPLLFWVEEPHSIIADERTFLARGRVRRRHDVALVLFRRSVAGAGPADSER